jgi:hypothetical protein
MSLVLLFHYLLLYMFRMLVHPSSGFISCVILLWFDVCWCYGVVRLGWCGILMQAEALVLQPHSARDQPQQFRMETAA